MVITLTPSLLASACGQLSHRVQTAGYEPTLLMGICRGGAEVSRLMRSSFPDADYCEVQLSRPGTKQKSDGKMHQLLQQAPVWMCDLLREMESRINAWLSRFKSPRRIGQIELSEEISLRLESQPSRILIIDDAIDTGATILQARNQILSRYPKAELRVAVITVTTDHPSCDADYCLYHNHTLCRFPWSGDYRNKA